MRALEVPRKIINLSIDGPLKLYRSNCKRFALKRDANLQESCSFFQQLGIHLHSTCSDATSAFAEGNHRSIAALFFDYIGKNSFEVYFGKIQAVISVEIPELTTWQNCRRSGSKNPTKFSQFFHKNSIPISKAKLKIGRHVRICRKTDLFHRGYRKKVTDEVYGIEAVETLNRTPLFH